MTADLGLVLDPATMLGGLSNLGLSAVSDIGSLLGTDLAPNLSGLMLDVLTSI